MNFWTKTKNGTIAHINGSQNMSDETLEALHGMLDALAVQMRSQPQSETCWKIQGKTNDWTDIVAHSSEFLIRRQFAELLADSLRHPLLGKEYRLLNSHGEVVDIFSATVAEDD